MKLYQVISQPLGGQLAATGGSRYYAFTAKIEAVRKFKAEKKRLQNFGFDFNLTLAEVETPNHVGAVMWMEYIENGYFSGLEITTIECVMHRVEKAA